MDVPSSEPQAGVARESSESDPGFYKRVLFFIGISSVAAIGSFGATLSRTERNAKIKPGVKLDPEAMETGASLARKALGRATVYALGGFSLFCYASWKLIGAKDFEEFRMKLGKNLPKIHRPREPEEIDWDEILLGGEKETSDSTKTR